MRMEIIQPFINSADAVLAEALHCATRVGELSMEEHPYESQGLAARVVISGEIEGRVIVDVEPETALRVANQLAGAELTPPSSAPPIRCPSPSLSLPRARG